MEDNYLIHHGVKGMKWGVRRQRKLYGLDDKPKNRSSSASQETKPGSSYVPKKSNNPFGEKKTETKKEKQPLTPEQKQKQINNLNAATQLTKIGTQTVGQAKQVHDSYLSSKKAKSALEEAQQMSDKELRDRVNRLNLERQYSQMSPATVSKGQQAVSAALNAAQIAGGLAVTGLTIATLIKQLKGN